ncbi:MAG: thioredoxin domain-containing protein [Candidatus Aenigmatarchaeota archaeon]
MVEEKVIVVKKSRILIAVIIVLAILAILFFRTGKAEYVTKENPVLGNLNAKVNVIEFSDYECPFCEAAEGYNEDVIKMLKQNDPNWEAPIPNIIKDYVNTGKVKLVFRHFPLHRNSKNAALAAKCAQEQDKFWEYHNILFKNYNSLTITDLKKYAVDLNLNIVQFNSCLDSEKYKESVENDLKDGSNLGVSGTPTFFIGNEEIGYEKIVGAQPYYVFKQVIESKLT